MRVAKDELRKNIETREAVMHGTVCDGIHVEYNVSKEDFDGAPLLEGLQNSADPCPRWGIVVKGQIHLKHGGREETVKAGDAYYSPPGHIVVAEAGTEVWQFGPVDQLNKTMDIVRANMRAFQKKEEEQTLVTSLFFPNYTVTEAEPNKL